MRKGYVAYLVECRRCWKAALRRDVSLTRLTLVPSRLPAHVHMKASMLPRRAHSPQSYLLTSDLKLSV